MTTDVNAFEEIVSSGRALSRAEAELVLASPDLIGIGILGELARKSMAGNRVTYGCVAVWPPGADQHVALAGELRITGAPESVTAAREQVRAAAAASQGVTLTGFSLADLLRIAGGDHVALADFAGALRSDGLEAVAEAPLDELGEPELASEVVRAARRGGLDVPRATISRASASERLALIERAVDVQRETSAFTAFAPLPRLDPVDTPATGYDDVRTVAAARLMCRNIPLIQVDWVLYGPKLAQVAIAYGAGDIDGVAATDAAPLGPRRAARQDIERQIQSAGAVPAQRDGRFRPRS